jgi:hypothetical protein
MKIRLTKLLIGLDLNIVLRDLLFPVLILYYKLSDEAALLIMRS